MSSSPVKVYYPLLSPDSFLQVQGLLLSSVFWNPRDLAPRWIATDGFQSAALVNIFSVSHIVNMSYFLPYRMINQPAPIEKSNCTECKLLTPDHNNLQILSPLPAHFLCSQRQINLGPSLRPTHLSVCQVVIPTFLLPYIPGFRFDNVLLPLWVKPHASSFSLLALTLHSNKPLFKEISE